MGLIPDDGCVERHHTKLKKLLFGSHTESMYELMPKLNFRVVCLPHFWNKEI